MFGNNKSEYLREIERLQNALQIANSHIRKQTNQLKDCHDAIVTLEDRLTRTEHQLTNALDRSCNGYTNYETWLVALHIDNTYGAEEHLISEVTEITGDNADMYDRANTLQDLIEHDHNPLVTNDADECPMYVDLLNSALSSVDWHEIVDKFDWPTECPACGGYGEYEQEFIQHGELVSEYVYCDQCDGTGTVSSLDLD